MKPGYTFEGEKQCACKVCGYTIKEVIPSLEVPDNKVVIIIPDYDKIVAPDSPPGSSGEGGSDDQPETIPPTKELLTKGKENRVPALPELPPKESGNFFAGWVNKATGEEVKKGDLLTGNIEIVPVWKDCGEGNHTDADEDYRCDECGHILEKPSNPDDTTDPDRKPTTDNGDKKPQDDGGIPTWAIILISCFGVALAAGGAVLLFVLKKKK